MLNCILVAKQTIHHIVIVFYFLLPLYLTVFYGVLDCPQTIPYSIFDLCEGVFVGSLHQQGNGARVPTLLNECVLLLSLKTGLGAISNSDATSLT